MRAVRLLLLLVAFLAAGFARAQTAASPAAADITSGSVVVVEIDGEINKTQLVVLRRALKRAERAGAAAVILEMNTFGGSLGACIDIQKALLAVKVPTYTFINTNAGSAGALIALATKQIWMAPVSAIGAAAPVQGGGQDLDKDMRKKTVSYFSSYARSVASQQGHNPDLAQAFIDDETEVKIGDEVISPKGKLLTLDAKAAARRIAGKPILAEGIADSIADLVRQAKLNGPVVKVLPSGFERVALALAGLAPLFLLGGIVCAYLEFKMPGATIPAILAVVFFALFFGGHYVAGLAGFEVVALFVLGVLLVVADFVFLGGSVAIALVGVALMFGAMVWAMLDRYPSQPWLPTAAEALPALSSLGLAIVFSAICIAVITSMLPKTRVYRSMVLSAEVSGGSSGPLVPVGSVLTGLAVGLAGVTRTPLRPAGKAQFGDTLVDVVSDGDFVASETEVEIRRIEGAVVTVRTRQQAPLAAA